MNVYLVVELSPGNRVSATAALSAEGAQRRDREQALVRFLEQGSRDLLRVSKLQPVPNTSLSIRMRDGVAELKAALGETMSRTQQEVIELCARFGETLTKAIEAGFSPHQVASAAISAGTLVHRETRGDEYCAGFLRGLADGIEKGDEGKLLRN